MSKRKLTHAHARTPYTLYILYNLLFLQDNENYSGESVYIDIALKVFGHDFGWLDFQGFENEVTYMDIIDAIVDKIDNTMPDKTNLDVNEIFYWC